MQFIQDEIFLSAKELVSVIPDESNTYIHNVQVQTTLHLCAELFTNMQGNIRAPNRGQQCACPC